MNAGALGQRQLRVASRAARVLGDSASLVRGFLRGQQNADGGFRGRAPESDLYYTVFALQGLLALDGDAGEAAMDAVVRYLAAFGEGDALDFVHLCCLVRCRALLEQPLAGNVAQHLEKHRAVDGGYHVLPAQPHGTAYAAFLAMGAYQDVAAPLPRVGSLIRSLLPLQTPDGGWVNEPGIPVAAANSSVAALAVLGNAGFLRTLRHGRAIRRTVRWLLTQTHPAGGFRAAPAAPLPDLLSTATVLHTLAELRALPVALREPSLHFIDTLWSNQGGFHGHWGDALPDAEYTFYGLLALGALGSLASSTP